MTDRQMMDDFIAWLAEHNYCKVTNCARCWFWGDSKKDQRYREPAKHCRHHHIETWPDDYCSDAVEVKRHDN